tara:strand:+ start:5217 stop:7817 length:2601 start_codon:yes stop_codon:yes gene_type:complete
MYNMRSYLDILNEAPARGLSSDGGLVNFNVDKSLPITKIKDEAGKVFDLHASEEDAQKFIDGSNAYVKFDTSQAQDVAGGNEKLDAIVKKYAKPGMSVQDIAAAEKEAGNDNDSRYVLAYIAKSLGLEGLYRADGSAYIYLDGDEVKSARGGNMDQALDVAKQGLLPDATKDKIEKVTKSSREDVAAKAREVMSAAGDESIVGDDPSGADDTGGKLSNEQIATKLKRVQELLAKATPQATDESFATRTYAEQLLEQISGQEAQELAKLMGELEGAMETLTDGQLRQQIEAAQSSYKKFQSGQTGDPGEVEGGSPGQIDTNSDSAIAAAVKDPGLWITNEMPKELKQANANGLKKATENGKKKSASVAAIQQIMKQIASVTGNKDMDIQADGLYGPNTIKAIKKAQELAGVTADGDPGAETAKKLVDFSKNPTGKGGIADTDLNNDIDSAIELFKKGLASFGGGAEQVTASVDFRHLVSIVEGKIDEALSPEDAEKLKAIIAELEPKMNDAEFMAAQSPEMQAKFKELTDLRKQYNDKTKEIQKQQEAIPAEMLKAVQGMGTDEAAVYAAIAKISDKQSFDTMVAKNPNLIATVLDDFSGGELDKVIGDFGKKGITIQVVKKPGMLGGGGEYKYNGKTYTSKGAAGGEKTPAGGEKPPAGGGSTPPPTPTPRPENPATAGITSSKDNNMTNKTKLSEASMNISMNGENAAEVSELIGILKNAGMPDAGPVSDMLPKMGDKPAVAMDPHDDMKMHMSTCGMGEEDDVDEAEYSNSPDETYGTADQQMIDLSRDSGVNAPKKMSKKPSWHSGDNPMESSIREQLWAALQEKQTNEAHRGKKKKSRGKMEDINTLEGSRGKKSRGKKSRG